MPHIGGRMKAKDIHEGDKLITENILVQYYTVIAVHGEMVVVHAKRYSAIYTEDAKIFKPYDPKNKRGT